MAGTGPHSAGLAAQVNARLPKAVAAAHTPQPPPAAPCAVRLGRACKARAPPRNPLTPKTKLPPETSARKLPSGNFRPKPRWPYTVGRCEHSPARHVLRVSTQRAVLCVE